MLRMKITFTLNYFYIYQLPIPRLTSAHPDFRPLVERAARLVGRHRHLQAKHSGALPKPAHEQQSTPEALPEVAPSMKLAATI
jgi:hypothetical protein